MTMPAWQRAYIVATCAVIGGAFAYAACDWAHWPRLTYRPVTGDILMTSPPGTITVNYLGTVAWGLGGAAVGALVGAALCAAFKRVWADRTMHLFGAWAITGIVLTGAYYTWNLWPW